MSEPFIAHSEISNEIYIICGKKKYCVTERVISAMKATGRLNERPQGDWIEEKLSCGNILHCSECGARPRRSEYGYDLRDNFCHNCGADMMKEAHND